MTTDPQTQPSRALVLANWKMHGLREDGLERARALASLARAEAPRCDIVICPPATLLPVLGDGLAGSPIALGGQDCHAEEAGAHTGDLSAPMLVEAGCAYAIVGHSERRADHGERDADIAGKAAAAHRAGMVAVICVGESLDEREAGRALAVVDDQVKASSPDGATTSNTAIAYEPIWAIGTGRTPTPADIEAMHAQIRLSWNSRFSGGGDGLRVLYGGSVKAQNAGEILRTTGVDGALVGGASLLVDDFWSICQACP